MLATKTHKQTSCQNTRLRSKNSLRNRRRRHAEDAASGCDFAKNPIHYVVHNIAGGLDSGALLVSLAGVALRVGEELPELFVTEATDREAWIGNRSEVELPGFVDNIVLS